MANVASVTISSLGTRSASVTVVLSGSANDTITNAQLVAAITSGPLFDFLSATYADAAAVKAAFDALPGVLVLTGTTGAGVAGLAWTWVASSSTPSVQLVNANAAGTFEAAMIAMHSITK
jgi:nitrate reductase gamma subunit